MRRPWTLSSTGAAIWLLAAPAFAQTSIVDLFPQPKPAVIGTAASGDAARRTVNRYAQCTVKHGRNNVLRWLNAKSAEERSRLIPIAFSPDCLGMGELRIPPVVLRGALFNALYREQFGKRSVGLQLLPLSTNQIPAANGDPTRQDFKTLITFGDCLVRKNPQAVRAVVLAEPGSANESAAFEALGPHYSECLVQGTQMRLSKSILASVLAEALYLESSSATAALSNDAPRAN